MVNPILYKSDKNTWMTPKPIASRVENLFPHGYLDPAIPEEENIFMPGARYEHIDYLNASWIDVNVYVNPPYGRVIGKWIDKFQSEFYEGNFDNGVMLLPGRLGAKWFQKITRDCSCWCAIDGRLKFLGAKNSAPFPSVVVLYTTSSKFMMSFIEEFEQIGLIWRSL